MKMEPVTPTEPKTIKRIAAETPIKKARIKMEKIFQPPVNRFTNATASGFDVGLTKKPKKEYISHSHNQNLDTFVS